MTPLVELPVNQFSFITDRGVGRGGCAVLIFAMLLMMGCGGGVTGNQAVVDNTPNHYSPWETGIAGITINMMSAEVIVQLGQPESYNLERFNELKYYDFGTYSLDAGGRVSRIYQHCFVHSSFPSTNIGNIHVLSTSAEVLTAYGTPDSIFASGGDVVNFIYYYNKDASVEGDVSLEIDFFPDSTVHSLYIRR